VGAAQSNHNNKSKNNEQRYGMHEYYMWEVHEVRCGVGAVDKGMC